MCTMCEDYKAHKMTFNQLVSNLFETRRNMDEQHVNEVLRLIGQALNHWNGLLDPKIDKMILMIEDGVFDN